MESISVKVPDEDQLFGFVPNDPFVVPIGTICNGIAMGDVNGGWDEIILLLMLAGF